MADETSESRYLPQDIITEILRKLPVKTLLRFKTVCKPWLALITNPRFHAMQRHVILSSIDTHSAGKVPNLANHSRHASVHTMQRRVRVPDELRLVFGQSASKSVTVVGPCNGVCMVHDDHNNAALWNHATRDYRILPRGSDSEPNRVVIYGFGSEELEEGRVDFQVLKLYVKKRDREERVPEFYKLSTGAWKDMKPLPEEYNSEQILQQTVSVNGVLYWVCLGGGAEEFFLLSFDTRRETFGKLDPPDVGGIGKLSCCTSSDGYKTLSYMMIGKKKIDLWVMRKGSFFVKEAVIDRDGAGKERQSDVWFNAFRYQESLASLSSSVNY